MIRLKNLYATAGLGHLPWVRLTIGIAVGLVAVALTFAKATGVVCFGVATFVLLTLAVGEGLVLATRAREAALVAALPEVIEAIAAGVASGEELTAAIANQAEYGPKNLRKSFTEFNRQVSTGIAPEAAIGWLQVELSNVYADQLMQLLLVSLRLGGEGLGENLNRLSQVIREQGALEGELSAKQGWVTGTAKLGLLAPWLIVSFLNARPEAHAFYCSAGGLLLLTIGLVICLFAYALILSTAKLPTLKRVFADAA